MKIEKFLIFGRNLCLTVIFLLVVRCSEEQFLIDPTLTNVSLPVSTTTTNTAGITDCSACTYVVPANTGLIDGIALGLKPGDVIGLDANIPYGSLIFRNLVGTYDRRILIKNCGGTARITSTGKGYGIKTQTSKYFRITGGETLRSYGIVIEGGHMSISCEKLSTDFEIDHVEIGNSGFAGIMAKTDPNCDDATIRGNFVMKGVWIHHNFIHDTGGEGIYAGNSFFMGMNTSCGVRLPHEIHYIRIFSNIVRNTGWDGIQLGCATKGASIHANVIENFGIAGVEFQGNGIQVGAGTGGVVFNNHIKKGAANGIIMMGTGDNVVYNNVIEETGAHGIFCDERYTPGPGFKFLNNTILNTQLDGIRIFAELVPMNVIVNNIIVNPGPSSTYVYPLTPEDAYVHNLNNGVRIDMSNNYFAMDNEALQMDSRFRVTLSSPIVDTGKDILPYHLFRTDFNYKARLKGAAYDIGAVEQF